VRAGKHVLVEQPMATRWSEGVALVEAASRAAVTFFPLPFLSSPELQLARHYLREEVIGKVVAAEAHLSLPGPPRANWYYSAEAEGGAMLHTAVCALSELAFLLGPAQRVTGFVNTLMPHRRTADGGRVRSAVDDNVGLLLEYATGQQAVVRSVWGPAFRRNSTIIFGRQGTVFMREGGRRVVVQSRLGPVMGGAPVEFMGLDWCYAFEPRAPEPEETVLGVFAQAVRSGQTGAQDAALALHVLEQMLRGYESAALGRAMALETAFEPVWERPDGLLDLSGPGFL
jgi:predicted dehydrogenase